MPEDPFAPIDATVEQVCRLLGVSRSLVRRKLAAGNYESYLPPGGRVRRIILASVYADRERAIAADERRPMPAGPGRPKQHDAR
jgi:excisionase family DNA binding protein